MPTYLQVENGEVLSYISGPRIEPSPTRVLADDALMLEYRQLEQQMIDNEQTGRLLYSGGRLSLPPDTRQRLSAAVDKTQIAADGVDAAVITISALRADGQVATNFNATRMFELRDGRIWRLQFVNGVATKIYTAKTSGRFALESTDQYKLVAPVLRITAYE